ncbi:MAG: ribonucleoside-diphosphate reductase subunit alpha [Alphaproteobacteria bacterium]|nr:ribonucleoside-diphosphate reductase subunit alpha [Alphaproteobacteria bacterium]MDA8004635.1 ribonucleoside-diphosphate reductase subunit alpha [Alphaproteobacteria bacterium]MDA8005367.1 ribonucleoside-diphosphate reductase subunit alpha [Alphaproteobacteria bacterium]MDA8012787.1 ribonucleoside-diphosphate reductase subunit alpha [Alphaproteobacteria bacterium]
MSVAETHTHTPTLARDNISVKITRHEGLAQNHQDIIDEIQSRFQNPTGLEILLKPQRDSLLTNYGKTILQDRYTLPGESFQDLFARVATHFADNQTHAARLYEYISRLWFMPSTPVLSNGGTNRGLPISCFLNEADDSLEGIVGLWNENVWLAARGGGIGSYWGNLRSLGEKVGLNGKTSGIIPFIRVMDSLTLAISQGSLRRGSAAVYLTIDHPEIEEFIEMRRPTGGDPNRKTPNLHHGVTIPDAFMRAVEQDELWTLRSPRDGTTTRSIPARSLWIKLLTTRIETGEPYLIFTDHVNRAMPEFQRAQGLRVKMSNLCSEITLPTGADRAGQERTAVCCLSSLNLARWEEWRENDIFVEDIMRFLDNVLEDFIGKVPETMERAGYAARRERSVGLGVMGFHSLLQSRGTPLESAAAKSLNLKIFKTLRKQADNASQLLARERGACPDAAEYGAEERFSHKLAIAPTASISIICGEASPCIEPYSSNAYAQKTLSGRSTIRNRYLADILARHNCNDEETWGRITSRRGSVQNLECLSDAEKSVFRTAYEIDQRWLIDLAADRAPYICQSQSLNLFLRSNIHKRDLHGIHMMAWKRGVKSLYYCRSETLQRGESANLQGEATLGRTQVPLKGTVGANGANGADDKAGEEQKVIDYEECLACQ